MIGQTLVHYKILEKIGSGGMGDVYLAEDTTLDRKVALKVLPAELAEREQRRARFEREAKTIAALNHPNIVTVYSVEKANGVHFITMELVKGKTLADLLPRQGFSLDTFFDIAVPLADAVAAAHEQGIVHRDLKPGNVMVTDDGRRIKVLDFGLAKPTGGFSGAAVDSNLPTAAKTEQGVIIGTCSYMSPEQARGKSVDARSDIFSMGIVFYEMLTGRRPFEGDTPTEVLSSIMKDVPKAVSETRSATPRELSRIVRRCLAKDPSRRLQSALDLRNELDELRRELDSGELLADAPPARAPRSRWSAALMLAGAAIGLFVLVRLAGLISKEPPRVVVPQLENPVRVTYAATVEKYPTWSPDGVRLAYEASRDMKYAPDSDIWVAQLGSGEPVNLTEDHPGSDRRPSWSPDGRQIAFFSDHDGVWGVYTMASIGGTPRSVLSTPGSETISGAVGDWSAPRWSRDGTKLVVSLHQSGENVVWVLSLQSLEANRIVLPEHDGRMCRDLSWSPDGHRFAYVESSGATADVTRLWTIPVSGGESVPLTDGRSNVRTPTWSRDGSELFYVSNRGGSMDLWQQALTEDGRPSGEPLPVTRGLGAHSAAFSPDGRKLAYSRARNVDNVWRVPVLSDRPATWADAEQVTAEIADIESLDLSPDGQLLAVSSDRKGNKDLWVLPAAGGEMTQLTTDLTPDWFPRWSPDGTEIAFYAYRSGNRDIWVIPSRGGPARQLTFHTADELVPTWSPDGQEISFVSQRTGNTEIWIVDASGNGEPRQLTSGFATSGPHAWSPTGGWLVFRSDNRLYRVSREGGEPVLLPGGEGSAPRFSPDGRSLYFRKRSGPQENPDLWTLSLENGDVTRLTRLEGRQGNLGNLATDGRYLYFTWSEPVGDIWVMDVVTDESD